MIYTTYFTYCKIDGYLKYSITKIQKIAGNMNNIKDFWLEFNKLNPNSKLSPNSIGNAKAYKEISDLFYDKYKLLFNSVPTSGTEMSSICNVINTMF